MTKERTEIGTQRYALLAMLLFAPVGMGAKGCDTAVVGDDGQCKTNCMGEGGAETGGTAGTSGKGGAAGKGGTAGTSGKGGSSTGGSMTGTGGGDTGGKGGGETGGTSGTAGSSTGGSGTGGGSDTGGSSGTAGTGGGMVGDFCGGLRGDGCADGLFCNIPIEGICGAADAGGTCTAKPELCTEIYAPVCGCDGMTYSSSCFAAGAGMSVASEGECDEPLGDTCGDLTGATCADGEFCNFGLDAQCGAADQTGTCELIPDACTKELNPVCGCDDVTYGNECTAHAAGVSVATTGECGTTQDFCGGIAGFGCPDDMFCDFPIETMCGSGDMTGTCKTMPEACTEQYAPVCGCDDMTYSNACFAQGAGVSVQAEGACK